MNQLFDYLYSNCLKREKLREKKSYKYVEIGQQNVADQQQQQVTRRHVIRMFHFIFQSDSGERI